MFSGRFYHAVDDKGRVSLPAKFRDVLQHEGHDRLYITNFKEEGEPCLDAYAPSEWEKVVARFTGKKVGDRATNLFETYYVGGAHEVQVDKQGRILIPPKLREYARLTREVTFNSKHNRIQLWDTPTFDKILKSAEDLLQDSEFMAKIDIEF